MVGIRRHAGIDLEADIDTPVYSVSNGTVFATASGNDSFGNYIIIRTGDLYYLYAHLKSEPTVVRKNTLRLWVSDGSLTVKAIGFGMGDYAQMLTQDSCLDLAYSVFLDTWQEPVAQLEIKDLKLKT